MHHVRHGEVLDGQPERLEHRDVTGGDTPGASLEQELAYLAENMRVVDDALGWFSGIPYQ